MAENRKLYSADYGGPIAWETYEKLIYNNGVIVYDGICGIGKTQSVPNIIKMYDDIYDELTQDGESPEKENFIYVAPYVKECHRIASTKPMEGLTENDYNYNAPKSDELGHIIYANNKFTSRDFKHPVRKKATDKKIEATKKLIRFKEDIVTTHAAMKFWDNEIFDLLEKSNYHLIIDEDPPLIEELSKDFKYSDYVDGIQSGNRKLSTNEITNFIKEGIMIIENNSDKLSWNPEKTYLEQYSSYMKFCKEEKLCIFKDGNVPRVMWKQNPRLFSVFRSIRLLTYLFKGSLTKPYFDLHKIDYAVKDMTSENFLADLRIDYRELITIYSDKNYSDEIPQKTNALSSSWYKEKANKPEKERLRVSTSNFFKKTKAPIKEKLWTAYSKDEITLTGNGYKKAYTAFNLKATNDHKKTKALAFLINYYGRPVIKNYFEKNNVTYDEKTNSVSVLIQWMFRSRLREEQPIEIFLPSKRMRGFLKDWIKDIGELYDDNEAFMNNYWEEFEVYITKRKVEIVDIPFEDWTLQDLLHFGSPEQLK